MGAINMNDLLLGAKYLYMANELQWLLICVSSNKLSKYERKYWQRERGIMEWIMAAGDAGLRIRNVCVPQ